VFLVIENLEYQQSRKIEKHIKRMKSKTFIENLKKYPELIEKLKRKYI
jgi:putative endonuclease